MYSVDRQWRLGGFVPFFSFGQSIPFYSNKKVMDRLEQKRVWIDQDIIDGPHCIYLDRKT